VPYAAPRRCQHGHDDAGDERTRRYRILIVSSSVNRGEAFRTYEALAAGAVDLLAKPDGSETGASWDHRYRAALRQVARIRVITHLRGRHRPVLMPPLPAAVPDELVSPRIIALGASTGGPAAVVDVLRGLSRAPIPVPVLIAIHISSQFATSLADWLDAQTPVRVSLATDGTALETLAGRGVLAPPDRHLTVAGGRIRLLDGPPRHSCRPSIDTLFESIAAECGPAAVAALLTGMGRDGATGLLAIRAAGGRTIAQDAETSIVHGMPREAMLLGAAGMVLPLGQIGPAIARDLRVPEPAK
jgi:two-component system chemotaxis response regulator CheB